MSNERKYAVEASEDGRFIVDEWLYNNMNNHVVNSQRENEEYHRNLKAKDEEIQRLKDENARLYSILTNITSEK